MFCRRYQTAASVREVDYAKADGVEFYYGMRPTRITDDGVYYKKVEMDEEGNITSTSEEQFFPLLQRHHCHQPGRAEPHRQHHHRPGDEQPRSACHRRARPHTREGFLPAVMWCWAHGPLWRLLNTLSRLPKKWMNI